MIRDFGSFTRRGLLADLERPAEILGWGHSTEREGEGNAREESLEARKTTDLPAVRVRDPKTEPHHGRYQ